MATTQTANENDSVEQLDKRDAAALTEYMTVLAEIGRARDAPGLFTVVGQNGGTYLVDTDTGACECPDSEYRAVRCKHRRRVAFATGERDIPEWVDRDAVDPDIGEHVDGDDGLEADGGEPDTYCKTLDCGRAATHTVVVNAPTRYAKDPACAECAEDRRENTYVRDVRAGYDG